MQYNCTLVCGVVHNGCCEGGPNNGVYWLEMTQIGLLPLPQRDQEEQCLSLSLCRCLSISEGATSSA